MKIQIRHSVFETNSSSVHAMTMCMDSDFQKWKEGKLIWSKQDECLIPVEEKEKYNPEYLYTYEDLFKRYTYLDTFYDTINTPAGETVHVFGLYGYEG